MKQSITAQIIYDLREETGFCSGKELHGFFQEVLGEPSPRGKAKVNFRKFNTFYLNCLDTQVANSPSLFDWRKQCLVKWYNLTLTV